MVQSIGGYGSGASSYINKLFSKLDTNNDGTVNRNEFVAGAPSDVSSDQAGSLFDQLAGTSSSTSGSTSAGLSQSSFLSAFQQMGAQMQSALIQAQASGSNAGTPGGPGQSLANLDTNGDGTVSRDEFIAGKPDNASADQAGALYDKIAAQAAASSSSTASASSSSSGLTLEQLASGLQKVGGGHHHHHHAKSADGDADDQSTSSSSSSTGQSNDPGQLLDQLLAALQAATGQGSTSSSTSQDGNAPPDPAQLFAKLDTNGDGKVSRDEFVSGKPDNVSTDQAGAFYDKIAGTNTSTDGLTKDQFTSGFAAAGPGGTDSASSSTASANDPGKLLDELLAALRTSGTSSSNSSTTSSTTSSTASDGTQNGTVNTAQLLDQLEKAIMSYQNTAYQSAKAGVAATSIAA